MYTAPEQLREKWNALRNEQPFLRIRDAARMLGVSEVELLVTRCGEGVTRLRSEPRTILKEIGSLGRVMALSRNEHVVHELKGTYENGHIDDSRVGYFLGFIDLRLFFDVWDSVFSVSEEERNGTRHSLQFFAKNGEAIHKIYMTEQSDREAYSALVKKHTAEDQGCGQEVCPSPEARPELPDEAVDVERFRQAWTDMQDTHEFDGLLRKYKLSRLQALRLAPEGMVCRVEGFLAGRVLSMAQERHVPIMVFVGNRGILQIFGGEIHRLSDHEGWFNVLDDNFNLHLRRESIKENRIVYKPTKDGVVTSLECYGAQGELLVQFFGKRKPGIPELPEWRDLVETLKEER